MSDEEGSQKPVKVNEDDDNEGEDLFDNLDMDADNKSQQKKSKKLKKLKKSKKQKKREKKQKKKKRREQELEQYDEQDEEDEQRNSMFEDEAQSDDEQENYSQDRSAQIGQDEERDRFDEMINKPRDNYLRKFEGKNDRDINALYSRDATMLRENQAMYPSQNDPKVYIVNVKPRHEDQIVLRLLNKARHVAETTNKVTVITATSMRKKYPGKIFVEAFSEKDIRDSLEGFNDVGLGRNMIQLDKEGYTELFNQKYETKVDFEPMNFVRINKGLYEGDLAQIIKIKSNSADVTVVPRLNIKQIAMKIRQQVSKITDQAKKKEKMAELLNLFLDHKSNNYKKRPTKNTVSQEALIEELGDNPAVKKIRLSGNPPGLIILNYRFDQISKHEGTYSPVQIIPFTSQGNFINKINEEKGNLTIATSYKKGQEVQIISGAMLGHYGIIYEVKGNIAVIICKNKELKDEKIEEPVQNIVKKFKQGQRVKVISGGDAGKTGIVLKIEQKAVQIWTDNQNSIRVNKKNLQVSKAQIICQENVHNLKKDDLIKTSKNQIGIVLETSKDNIRILDTNNTIQIVANMDFDSKLNTKNIIAKNRTGDEIGAGCSVIVRHGAHQGKKCKVIHVYRQNIFLFNPIFNRTAGISVENAENCSLVSKNEPTQSRNFSVKNANQANIGTTDSSKDQITVGKTIILRSGPLKGYQGIVKSINKDKIEVRVLSKACTEWVPRANVTTKQETMQIGKTPNRRGGNTHSYAPSPSRY